MRIASGERLLAWPDSQLATQWAALSLGHAGSVAWTAGRQQCDVTTLQPCMHGLLTSAWCTTGGCCAGADHTAGVTAGGALLTWGSGQQGQLGRVGERMSDRAKMETLLTPHAVVVKRAR